MFACKGMGYRLDAGSQPASERTHNDAAGKVRQQHVMALAFQNSAQPRDESCVADVLTDKTNACRLSATCYHSKTQNLR